MSRRLLIPYLTILALALWAGAAAQAEWEARVASSGVDRALPFEVVRAPGGDTVYTLGVNRFTSAQVIEFLAGLEPFVARAETIEPGVQLVWSVDGVRGYLSVSTSPFADGPRYLMTLRGEPVRTFEDTAALLDTMTRLGLRVLEGDPGVREPAAGAASPTYLTR